MGEQNVVVPKQYFYSGKTGPDPDGLKRAFMKSGELAVARGCSAINLAVPKKGNLDGIMEEVLGEQACDLLQKNNELPLDSITIYLVTKRVPISFEGPVVAAWADMEQIKELNAHYRTKDLIYLAWLDEELAEFKRTFPVSEEI